MSAIEEVKPALSISGVERETGLSKDTLRMWERRYGFPQPVRDAFGDRLYPDLQVEKLRLIRRLMDQGLRPGKLIPLPYAKLVELSEAPRNGMVPAPLTAEFSELLALIRQHQVAPLRESLTDRLRNQGLRRFVLETVLPLNIAVGEAWFRGDLAIFEEHVYSEILQTLLRRAISETPVPPAPPRILMTTFPNEQHSVGLLMAEAVMCEEGVECLTAGIQIPVTDIARAAQSHRADVIALSFSAAYPRTLVVDGLAELRALTPPTVEIWAGGAGIARIKRAPPHVILLRGLDALPLEVTRWRNQQDARVRTA